MAVGAWTGLGARWSFAGGFGVDDTADADLSAGFRSYNAAIQGNVFYSISRQLTVGLDVSRWQTAWVNLPDGRVVRVEPALIYVF